MIEEPIRFGTKWSDYPQPKWDMRLSGSGDLIFKLAEGPNWIHRHLQRMCLGIVWTRIEEKGGE